ncbi:IclR family transcriptional regulator [Microbacterium tenebrionis]|uniref:IclR family transcriptional regulator n=1 Tax=Microbacterium tenebrionis TaxID=2830665 RepID=UPI00158B90B2|nr:IclR family transcriptional regulator [Microbacterium ihumii]
MEQRATSYHSQGLVRAIRLLGALEEADRPLSLASLSTSLDLPKSTLVRLLAILEEHDYVFREGTPPTFGIGHAVFELSESYRRQVDADALASPYLRRVADDTGLTANVGVLQGRSVLHVCVEEPSRPLRFRSASGSLDHAYCTGLGKMLLSALDRDAATAHLPEEPFTGYTDHTLTSREALDAELEAVRGRGFSIDDEERDPGVTCIAVPIVAGSVNAAVSVAGPSAELAPARRAELLDVLRRSAAELAADTRFVSALRLSRSASTREDASR